METTQLSVELGKVATMSEKIQVVSRFAEHEAEQQFERLFQLKDFGNVDLEFHITNVTNKIVQKFADDSEIEPKEAAKWIRGYVYFETSSFLERSKTAINTKSIDESFVGMESVFLKSSYFEPLGDKQRELLMMIADGYTYQEIAEKEGSAVSHIYKLVKEAKARLAESIKE